VAEFNVLSRRVLGTYLEKSLASEGIAGLLSKILIRDLKKWCYRLRCFIMKGTKLVY